MNKQSTRQIKFRAWDGKKMIYPDGHKYVLRFDGTIGKFDEIIKQYHTEEWKLMQFTGLLDKNGKEIYEGDLLKFNDSDDSYYRVFWNIAKARFQTERFWPSNRGFTSIDALERSFASMCGVAGDIHRNSNLLQG